MPAPTLKGIRNAVGRFAAKFRRTKKQPSKQLNTPGLPKNSAIVRHNHVNSMEDLIKILTTAKKNCESNISDLSNRNKQLLETLQNYNKLNYTEQIKNLTSQVNGCESDLAHANGYSDKQQTEINELKAQIHNYQRILEDSNKTNRDLQDELVKCEGSQSHKLSRGSSRSQKSGSRRSTMANSSHNRKPISMTGAEMYNEYKRIKALTQKPTTWQRNFVNSIDDYITNLIKGGRRDLDTDKAKQEEILKVLNRWQTYNPSYRMPDKLIGDPTKLINNRPDDYIWYQGKLYADKTKNAFPVNNAFGYPGYGPN